MGISSVSSTRQAPANIDRAKFEAAAKKAGVNVNPNQKTSAGIDIQAMIFIICSTQIIKI